jgi:phosphatidylserine/phosphatidylglycerophosphate/cardiolipin synthase-like enzyme
MKASFLIAALCASFAFTSCSNPEVRRAPAEAQAFEITQLPKLAEPKAIHTEVVQALARKKTLTPEQREMYGARIEHYLAFLGVGSGAQGLAQLKTVLSELMNSSTQFLLCADLSDWSCLEKKPEIVPTARFRQESAPDLGDPLHAGSKLETESYFTARWNNFDPATQDAPRKLAARLADKLRTDGTRSIHMALYGIDDVQGSMKPVYDAILEQAKKGVDVRAVIDASNEAAPNSFLRDYDLSVNGTHSKVIPLSRPLIFSYVPPKKAADQAYWIFGRPGWMDSLFNGEVEEIASGGMDRQAADAKWFMTAAHRAATRETARTTGRMAFQYDGSMALIGELNSGIASDDEAKARVEWPSADIMHNKYFVLQDASGRRAVWTGTTNVAQTCMGDETNANMALYIRNDAIAQAYEDEFNEMYAYDGQAAASKTRAFVLADGKEGVLQGRFHGNKTANTHRYFTFDDGTEAAVHFSPTDDGAHRSIYPMLLSARAGDEIRISMFGASGLESVRAIQYAAARGANVRVVLDTTTGGGQPQSWVKHPFANLLDKNPYLIPGATPGKIEVRVESWAGLNHHKTATLSRLIGPGRYRAETLIVGSQNWSDNGNNGNDENMITIRNRTTDVEPAVAFNREFDEHLWPAAALESESHKGKAAAAVPPRPPAIDEH